MDNKQYMIEEGRTRSNYLDKLMEKLKEDKTITLRVHMLIDQLSEFHPDAYVRFPDEKTFEVFKTEDQKFELKKQPEKPPFIEMKL